MLSASSGGDRKHSGSDRKQRQRSPPRSRSRPVTPCPLRKLLFVTVVSRSTGLLRCAPERRGIDPTVPCGRLAHQRMVLAQPHGPQRLQQMKSHKLYNIYARRMSPSSPATIYGSKGSPGRIFTARLPLRHHAFLCLAPTIPLAFLLPYHVLRRFQECLTRSFVLSWTGLRLHRRRPCGLSLQPLACT
jgi:hypothetical protein